MSEWKLVPVEPTQEMLSAAGESIYGHSEALAIQWAKHDKFESCALEGERAYKAMIAAAPKSCSCSKTEGEICSICDPAAQADVDDEIRAPDVIRGEDGSPEQDPDLSGSWHLVGPSGRKYSLTPNDLHRIFKTGQDQS